MRDKYWNIVPYRHSVFINGKNDCQALKIKITGMGKIDGTFRLLKLLKVTAGGIK